jgi:hypothetical protein
LQRVAASCSQLQRNAPDWPFRHPPSVFTLAFSL